MTNNCLVRLPCKVVDIRLRVVLRVLYYEGSAGPALAKRTEGGTDLR
jgi:hypothetical protein